MYKTEITHSPHSQNSFPKKGDTDKNDTEKSQNYQFNGNPQATAKMVAVNRISFS